MKQDLTRRQFLGTAGATILCSSLSPKLHAEPMTNPIAVFSKVYQELKLNFEQSAEVTAEAGLDGIDCSVRPGGEILPERAADDMPLYAEALAKHKVRMLLLTTGILEVKSPNAEKILRTAKKLGIKYYRIGYWQHKPETPKNVLVDNVKAQLKDLSAMNREIGVCALFQNHAAGKNKAKPYAGGDLNEMYDIMKDLDPQNMGVAFDLGHAIRTHGDEWPSHFEKLKSHIKIAYIKDVKRDEGFVPFGQGEFGGTDFFSRLKKMNYNEPFSMHIEFEWAEKGKPKTREALVNTLSESRQMLRKWMTA
ncbi:MAG: hypothetical protein A2283_09970 [Lentisphaerae bacterium RIFOXYA12_FULL_48_11]|nr:MAG: hypothetical protein A2283_09970 [Lentisphaerae bacterium RIFOXYA12_FULL_48_11]